MTLSRVLSRVLFNGGFSFIATLLLVIVAIKMNYWIPKEVAITVFLGFVMIMYQVEILHGIENKKRGK